MVVKNRRWSAVVVVFGINPDAVTSQVCNVTTAISSF